MIDLGLSGVLLIGFAMLCGGAVKGVVGLGLPVVSISIMTTALPVPSALALVTIPSVVSNLYQLVRGGDVRAGVKRFWPLILALAIGLWWSAGLLVRMPTEMLYGAVGLVVVTFCVTAYATPHLRIAPRSQAWLGVLAGFAGGAIGGFTAIHGPPITLYLVALNLPKERFVAAVGLIWFCAAVPLTAAYAYHGILTAQTAEVSLFACIPVIIGFLIGQWLRQHIDQETFRKVLLAFLLLLGLNLIRRAVF